MSSARRRATRAGPGTARGVRWKAYWLALATSCDPGCPELPEPGTRLRVEVAKHVESTGRVCAPLAVGDVFTRTVWAVETPYDQAHYDERGECPEVTFAPEVPSFLAAQGAGWECRGDVCVAGDERSGDSAVSGRLEMRWDVEFPADGDARAGRLTVLWLAPSGRTCRSTFEVMLSREGRR